MRRKIRAFFINPVIIIVPLVFLLSIAWRHYLYDSHHYSLPTHNILPNASFSTPGQSNMPEGWQLQANGSAHVITSRTAGHINGRTLKVNVSDYKDGETSILSPVVSVSRNTTYLYESYYKARAPFDILLDRYYKDGSSTLTYLQHYGATNDVYWSTVSTTFRSDPGLKAVQIVYRLSANNTLQLNGNYLEPKKHAVYLASDASSDHNLLEATKFDASGHDKNAWVPFRSGQEDAQFTYWQPPGQASFARIVTQNYYSGEAKWQSPALTVPGGEKYRFSYSYRSNAVSELVAEYVMKDGSREFQTVATVAPAAYWTTVEHSFEVPANTHEMTVTPVLKSNGYLDTRGYALFDTTRPGPLFFKKPLVSIAFYDGWQTTYTNSAPLLVASKTKATFYVSPLALDTKSYMTTNQILQLKKTGNEIGVTSYRLSRLNTFSDSQINYQLKSTYKYIANELNTSKINFATSAGENNPIVRALTPRYYASSLSVDSGINTRQNFDQYNLRTFLVGNNTTTKEIRQALAAAKAQKAWLIIAYPKIDTGKNQTVAASHLKDQLSVVRQNDVPVVTVRQALHELIPQTRQTRQ
jgi:peptidoglycan/xylan/chitin deacetylase (PgdA/CDA1 family)